MTGREMGGAAEEGRGEVEMACQLALQVSAHDMICSVRAGTSQPSLKSENAEEWNVA